MADTTSAGISYLPIRSLSGLFAANGVVTDTGRRKVSWKPNKSSAWVDKNGLPTVELVKFIDYVSEHILGGSLNKTLPQVESLITYAQAESLFSNLLGNALQQMAVSNAQSIASIREVLVAAGTTGAAQIPAVQLTPVEVAPPFVPDPGGAGAGGDGGGGD